MLEMFITVASQTQLGSAQGEAGEPRLCQLKVPPTP